MKNQSKRYEIMDAAESLFINRRFHEVTLDEIAQAARVGKGTIYRYFSNKDDLFFQTATFGFEVLCSQMEQNVQDKRKGFDAQLQSACNEVMDFFHRRRQMFRMMQMEEGRVIWSQGSLWDQWMAKREKLLRILADILELGVSENRIRKDVPTTVLAEFLLGMLRTQTRYLRGADKVYKRVDFLQDMFLFGASGRAAIGIDEEV